MTSRHEEFLRKIKRVGLSENRDSLTRDAAGMNITRQ